MDKDFDVPDQAHGRGHECSCGHEHKKQKGSWAQKLRHKDFWKGRLAASLYFAGTVLCMHDMLVLLIHSAFPKFLPEAHPYFLDKFFEALINVLAF